MNYQKNTELIDKLAAEYVLGTLRHGARKRFEHWMTLDENIRVSVYQWQNKLYPLIDYIPLVTPPARVWQSIEARLFKPAHSTSQGWWNTLSLWRYLSGLSLAASALLGLYIAKQPGLPLQSFTSGQYISVLSTAQHEPSIIIDYDELRQQLQLTQLHLNAVPPQKTLELWSISEQGTPVSLGVLKNQKAMVIALHRTQVELLKQTKAIAISLEPLGGSPTGLPTGPVLHSGKLLSKISAPASIKNIS
ncbi:MAG: anti-sigma factor [Pseudomonadota bacterium]